MTLARRAASSASTSGGSSVRVIHERNEVADSSNCTTGRRRHGPPVIARPLRHVDHPREQGAQMTSGGTRGFTVVTIITLVFAPFFNHHQWVWRLVGETKTTRVEQ